MEKENASMLFNVQKRYRNHKVLYCCCSSTSASRLSNSISTSHEETCSTTLYC